MLRVELVATAEVDRLRVAARDAIARAPDDAVLTLRVHGELTDAHWPALTAATLRAVAPPTMNVDVIPVDMKPATRDRSRVREASPRDQSYGEDQLALF
jgi:hypothetical protein